MKDTFVPSQNYVTKKWYVINAENQTLGRLATKISTILTGKKKISYTPFLETGDNVIIINAEKITISGNKSIQKLYRNHSGRPGGMRIETFSKLQQRRPEKLLSML